MASELMDRRQTVDVVCAACGEPLTEGSECVDGEDYDVYCMSCSEDMSVVARDDDDDDYDDDDDDLDDDDEED